MTKEIIKRFDGKIGEEYNLFRLACPHYDELQETVVGGITSIRPKSILEIGCGNGCTTALLVESNPTARITAIDNETTMIRQAKNCLDEYVGEGQVKLVEQDALDYLQSLPTKSVDAVASVFTLHNFQREYRGEILKEIHRVLNESGIFVNGDKYARDNRKEHQQDLAWQLEQFKLYDKMGRPELRQQWREHYLEDEAPKVIMLEEEAIAEMKKIGFSSIDILLRKKMEAILSCQK
ncbi:hypothetical protein CL619_02785 [archaeon]|nr:hypothetical protein [archaeon]|tara:strand:- start:602 stop:1309 length:708 start_codon:yes stop_codon:yes gene_type:complete